MQRVLHPSLEKALGAVLDLTVGREMAPGDTELLVVRKTAEGSLTISTVEVEPNWALDRPVLRVFDYSSGEE